MSCKNLENRENFSFLKGAKMRYLDVSNVIPIKKRKIFSKELKISFKGIKVGVKELVLNLCTQD
jgi:hypothetical protein